MSFRTFVAACVVGLGFLGCTPSGGKSGGNSDGGSADGGNNLGGGGTLTLHFNDVENHVATPTFAYQDGDGAWQAAPAVNASGDVSLEIHDSQGRYGIAHGVGGTVDSKHYFSGALIQATLAEANDLHLTAITDPTEHSGTLHITLPHAAKANGSVDVFCAAQSLESYPDIFEGSSGDVLLESGSTDCLASSGDDGNVAHHEVERTVGVPGSVSFDFNESVGGQPRAFVLTDRAGSVHDDTGSSLFSLGGGIVLSSSRVHDIPVAMSRNDSIAFDASGNISTTVGMAPQLDLYHGRNGLDYFYVETTHGLVETFVAQGAPLSVTMPPVWSVRSLALVPETHPQRFTVTYDEVAALPVRTFSAVGADAAGNQARWGVIVTAGATAGQSGSTRTWSSPQLAASGVFTAEDFPGTGIAVAIDDASALSIGSVARTLDWAQHAHKPAAGETLYTVVGAAWSCYLATGDCEDVNGGG